MRKKHHTGRTLRLARAIQKTVEKERVKHTKEEFDAQYQVYVSAWRFYLEMIQGGIPKSEANYLAKRTAREFVTSGKASLGPGPQDQIIKAELDDFVKWMLLDEDGNLPTYEEMIADAGDQPTN